MTDDRPTIIAKLLELTTVSEIKDTLGLIEPDADVKTNIDLINVTGVLRPTLILTFDLLCKSSFNSHRTENIRQSKATTKPLIARDIVNFIFSLFPAKCSKCDDYYSSNKDETPELTCYKCNRGSHPGCFSAENVEETMGIFYFCSECIPSLKKLKEEDTEPPAKSAKKQADPPATQLVDTQEIGHTKPPMEATKPSVGSAPSKNSDSNKKDICPLLLKGICPHGVTGLNCTSGHHPVRCWQYSKYGTDKRWGCTRKHCKFHHPKLCQNSLIMKTCYNKDCKEVHLRGTKRSEREREAARRDYERPRPYNNEPYDLHRTPKRRKEERYNRPYQEPYQPPATSDDPAWPQPRPYRTPRRRRESERHKPSQASSKFLTSDDQTGKPQLAHDSKEKAGPPPESQEQPNEQAHFLRFMESMKADLATQLSQQINTAFLNISKQIPLPAKPMLQDTGMMYQYPSQNFQMTNPYQVPY